MLRLFVLLGMLGFVGLAAAQAQTTPYNVVATYGAVGDAVWGVTGCQFITTTVTDDTIQCPNGTFSNATKLQQIIADNCVISASIVIPGTPYQGGINSIEDPPTNSKRSPYRSLAMLCPPRRGRVN